MNETKNMRHRNKALHWQLLSTVSALALLSSTVGVVAADDDSDRVPLWIEFGAQLERLDGGQTPFAPAFFNAVTTGGFTSPQKLDAAPRFSTGLNGKISFQPEESDWIFSGAIRYGRSGNHRYFHAQKAGQTSRFAFFSKYLTKTAPPRYLETNASNSDSHLIADFQAGKDVGMGMFGHGSTSTFNFGVRYARLDEQSDATIRARPDVHFVQGSVFGGKYHLPLNFYHEYYGSVQRAANFDGIGPSISWNASAPIAGNAPDGEISVDWGVNAALLFGRQRAKTHHHTTGSYRYYPSIYRSSIYVKPLPTHHGTGNRSRSVTVPNVGGFAGLSFHYADAKVSFGYRADVFFGAMDGGLDSPKSYNRNFYGPFANVSVGIGD